MELVFLLLDGLSESSELEDAFFLSRYDWSGNLGGAGVLIGVSAGVSFGFLSAILHFQKGAKEIRGRREGPTYLSDHL